MMNWLVRFVCLALVSVFATGLFIVDEHGNAHDLLAPGAYDNSSLALTDEKLKGALQMVSDGVSIMTWGAKKIAGKKDKAPAGVVDKSLDWGPSIIQKMSQGLGYKLSDKGAKAAFCAFDAVATTVVVTLVPPVGIAVAAHAAGSLAHKLIQDHWKTENDPKTGKPRDFKTGTFVCDVIVGGAGVTLSILSLGALDIPVTDIVSAFIADGAPATKGFEEFAKASAAVSLAQNALGEVAGKMSEMAFDKNGALAIRKRFKAGKKLDCTKTTTCQGCLLQNAGLIFKGTTKEHRLAATKYNWCKGKKTCVLAAKARDGSKDSCNDDSSVIWLASACA